MTPKEMTEKLKKRMEYNLSTDETIELSFAIMQRHPDKIERYRAAVILSGMVQKGLGKRTLKFLAENPKLPKRVQELLYSSIMRMECF